MNKAKKDEMENRRRVVRINNNTYELLKEIQKGYERRLGFSPSLSKLIEMGISTLAKKIDEENKSK